MFRYCGEYFDKETGTIYLRARYYDPRIGRFITEDSYWGKDSDPLSLNLYTYCHNDPVNFFDPNGHLESRDTAAYYSGMIDKATYDELVRLGNLYASTGNTDLGRVQKNGFRRQAVAIRKGSYAPDYIDNYDYTYGGTFNEDKYLGKTFNLILEPEMKIGIVPFGVDGININSIPKVNDPTLQNIIKDLYKGVNSPNKIGNGTTMDAIRNELATGKPTGGTFHFIKGWEYLKALEKIMDKVNDVDKNVVKTLINDLKNALSRK